MRTGLTIIELLWRMGYLLRLCIPNSIFSVCDLSESRRLGISFFSTAATFYFESSILLEILTHGRFIMVLIKKM